jgi:hypothetical protein
MSGIAIFIISEGWKQPAPRAVDDVAEERDADEEEDAEEVSRHREAHQELRRDLGEDPHRPHRDAEVDELRLHARRVVVARGEERGKAEQRQHERQDEERPVDALDQALADAADRQAVVERAQSLSLSGSTSSSSGACSMPGGSLPSR